MHTAQHLTCVRRRLDCGRFQRLDVVWHNLMTLFTTLWPQLEALEVQARPGYSEVARYEEFSDSGTHQLMQLSSERVSFQCK